MSHRLAFSLALALAFVACGGDASAPGTQPPPPSPPPPPPPPAPPQAVALAIHAGGQQTGEPLVPAAVRPAVVARAADGSPVAGVAVSFAVDSGGGSVTGASVTTGADGVATVGSWLLGPIEGRQVLVASAGALPAARFVATTTITPRAVVEQDLTSGTLRVESGPLTGVRLEVPAGAFAAPARWTIEQRSVSEWPTRRGIHPVGASLVIRRSAAGLARAPMRLTLPARLPAGTKPVVVVRDPASGAIDVLPLVDADSVSITAAALHFDPTYLTAARSGASAGRRSFGGASIAATSGYNVQVVVSAVPVAELDKDQGSSYQPGRDDWDIAPLAQAVEDPLGGSNMAAGLVLSSMVRNSINGLRSLHGLHRQIPGVASSNRVGFRAGADIGQALPDQLVASVLALRNTTRGTIADQLAHDWLKAALYVTGLPQLAFASVGNSQWVPLVAWRAAGGQVSLANPWRPGDASIAVPFSNGRFAPFSVVTSVSNGAPVTSPAQWLSVASTMQLVNVTDITSALADWEAGRYPTGYVRPGLGQDALDTSVVVRANGGFVEDTIIYATRDTTQLWVECGQCKLPLLPSPLSPRGIAPFVAYVGTGTPPAPIDGSGAQGALVPHAAPRDDRVGLSIVESDGSYARWLDFRWMRLKRWVLDTRPPARLALDATSDWDVRVDGPTLPAHRFRWTFGVGATPQVVTSTSSKVTVTLTRAQVVADSVPVRVELLRAADNRVLSVKEFRTSVAPLTWGAWRLTSVGFSTPIDMRKDSTICLQCAGIPSDTVNVWSFYLQRAGAGSAFHRDMVDRVRADSIELAQLVARPDSMMVVYVDTPGPSLAGPNNTRAFLIEPGLFLRPTSTLPAPDRTELPYGLAPSQGSPGHLGYSKWFDGNVSCVNDHPRRWARSAAPLSAGTVSSVVWTRSWGVNDGQGGTRPEPIWLVRTSFTSTGTTATGTWTLVYVLANRCGILGSSSVNQRKDLLLTREVRFTAERIR